MDVKDSPIEAAAKISLGGKDYSLSYPIPALWAFEDITGLDLLGGKVTLDQIEGKGGRERTRNIAALCYAGIKTKHPEVTFEEVSGLIFLDNLEYVTTTTAAAFFASLPKSEAKEATEESPLAEKVQVVLTSGPSLGKTCG